MDQSNYTDSAATVQCPLCERSVPDDYTCNHYLVPKSRKGRETIRLCEDCNKQIHVLFKPKDLEKRLSTLDLLKADEKVQTWIEWISKRKV